MKRLLLGVGLSTILFGHASAQMNKQTSGDDEIVSLGTLIGVSERDGLTSPTTVLNEDEIQRRNQAYVADLLRTVPGLAVSQSGGGGSLTQIRLRGSEANHVLVIIDGVQMNNPNDGAFDFGGLRSEDVVKIEVLRGEQSALYGSDAIGGVINIITRAGHTQAASRGSLEYGSRNTVEGQISGGFDLGKAVLTVNANIFETDGFDISGTNGSADGADNRSFAIGLNRLTFGELSLSGKFGIAERSAEFDEDSDFDGRLNDTESVTDVTQTTARLDGRFTWASFDHLVQAHQVETQTDTQAGFSSDTTGKRQNASWAAKRQFADVHTLTLLGEFEREEYQFEGDEDVPSINNYGLVADYRFSQDALTLAGSVRHDINDVFADATTWRVGAGYGFNWNGRLRGSVGTGVKNPTLIELFGFFPASRFTGNPDLKPETSLGYSLGYEHSFSTLRVSLDYFRSELSDEITTIFNPDFTSSVVNQTTDSTREGLEITADWAISDQFTLKGSASFLNSEENDTDEIRRPETLASATATWTPTDELSLTVNADHTGKQFDTDFATFSTVTLKSYTLVGANIRYEIMDNLSVYLRGTNLLDEDYQDVVGFSTAGRGVFAGLSANF
jgi:vitamin B12 transporter